MYSSLQEKFKKSFKYIFTYIFINLILINLKLYRNCHRIQSIRVSNLKFVCTQFHSITSFG